MSDWIMTEVCESSEDYSLRQNAEHIVLAFFSSYLNMSLTYC